MDDRKPVVTDRLFRVSAKDAAKVKAKHPDARIQIDERNRLAPDAP